MKRRAGQIAKELGRSIGEMVELAKKKLSSDMIKPFGPDVWINEEGQEILKEAIETPEVVPSHRSGKVIREAPNPRIIYCQLKETGEVVPVFVPKSMSKKLLKKTITVEEIRDADGATFRWVSPKRT